MKETEKDAVMQLRQKGMGYSSIAKALSLSVNTVKSFCRRNNQKYDDVHVCVQCGEIVPQKEGCKEKKFCSDTCRTKWWNHHTDLMKKNAVCHHCGKSFHGRAERKYCSHSCYIAERFGDKGVS